MPEELELLSEWKERLGLHDWTITLITGCNPDALMDDADGDVEYVESTKCAKIQIVDTKLRREGLRSFDFEEVLVHELLHLKLSFFAKEDWGDDLQSRIAHQLVDDLARAFVDAKRCRQEMKR